MVILRYCRVKTFDRPLHAHILIFFFTAMSIDIVGLSFMEFAVVSKNASYKIVISKSCSLFKKTVRFSTK